MKKKYLSLLACLGSLCCFGQIPSITLSGQENNSVKLRHLKVTVQVLGNIAQVKTTMTFFNSSSRPLEGELNFPMPDGVSVSHYALDFNGVLRDAVVVENQKAKQVFESIERRRVDPGLLEKTEGNNYKTRIYPIPANGARTVEIGYNEVLKPDANNNFAFQLPLQYTDKLQSLELIVDVIGATEAPIVNSEESQHLVFQLNQQIWHSTLKLTDTDIKKGIAFVMPNRSAVTQSIMQDNDGYKYFLINPSLNDSLKNKTKPTKITVLWDVSLSALNRNKVAEISLLQKYLSWIGNTDVQLITFNQGIKTNTDFKIINGNSNDLLTTIKNEIIDGGTSYDGIEKAVNDNANEVLLFSDGQNGLGVNKKFFTKKIPFYAIISAPSSNLESLKPVCFANGGDIIQLLTDSVNALNSLTHNKLYYLGYKNNSDVTNVYPSIIRPVNADGFKITGVSTADKTSLVLLFGYGNKATIEMPVTLESLPKKAPDYGLDKIWAQEKIAELETEYPVDNALITSLGKKYTIVTHGTSLMVLETANDYVRYNIDPPASLKDQCAVIRKQQGAGVTTIPVVDFTKQWQNFLSWYDKDYNVKSVFDKSANKSPKAVTRTGNSNTVINNSATGSSLIQETNSVSPIASSPSMRQENSSVQAATVVTRDTASFANNTLDQVVVVGYGTQKRKDMTGSISTVSGKEIKDLPSTDVGVMLQGRVPGVEVINASGEPGSQAQLTIRGVGSLNQPPPLYVIDGVIQQTNPINTNGPQVSININPADIESISVLKDAAATAIYGASASGGVILITTKKGTAGELYQFEDGSADDSIVTIDDCIRVLSKTPMKSKYKKYLSLREQFVDNADFYFQVSQYFESQKMNDIAFTIMCNVAELSLQNADLYKALGYSLWKMDKQKEALTVFEKVAEWRSFEPQSFRDLGLALQANQQYQLAADTLQYALQVLANTDRGTAFDGMETTLLLELNHLQKEHPEVVLKSFNAYKKDVPLGLSIILNWNRNDTDNDIYITDPNGEICWYGHAQTAAGAWLINDQTNGYGPEQVVIKKAIKGKYKISVHFYGSSNFKDFNTSSIFIQATTNAGESDEINTYYCKQLLAQVNATIELGTIEIK
jgi:TonB-dependent SusC/RagA subfamily outer membrane receptor